MSTLDALFQQRRADGDFSGLGFPKDAFALGRFDGTPLYEDPDPMRCGTGPMGWNVSVMQEKVPERLR